MPYLRVFSILFFAFMLLNKIGIIPINFIDRTTLHYTFNGSILILIFTLILPLTTIIKLKIWQTKTNNEMKNLLENLDIKEEIDIYLSTNIFSNSAVTLYGWKKPIIVLGGNVVKKVNDSQLKFILSHEACHIKEKHLMKSFSSVLLSLVISPIVILYFSSIIFEYSMLFTIILCASLYLFILTLHYKFLQRNEYKADIYATKIVGKDIAISTLNRLKEINSIKENKIGMLETHPSISKRINKIIKNV
ncbi:M48 family metallopeptidase [Metabacillus idriensis]|uniref:M48 family metallopeptidase n=1 Tax=Metabacillus idriensis TaxID=324768 RepID=UPI00174BCEC2|nr:M48 family metalloprotease [Metabacillus idriensis]